MSNSENESHKPQYWVWVTRPKYYLEETGHEREILEDVSEDNIYGYWTCHRDTKEGDLVLLYRTTLKGDELKSWRKAHPNSDGTIGKDISYLIRAESDAYSLSDDKRAREAGFEYGCEWRTLYKFKNPITLQDMRENPYLKEWGALRASFLGTNFRISADHWKELNNMAARDNPGYDKIFKDFDEYVIPEHGSERGIEDYIAENLDILKDFGYNLELKERQYICKGLGGRIDMLCYDPKQNMHVVIELKTVRAGRNTFGQVSTYLGWVKEEIAGKNPVKGLVISRGYDNYFRSAMNTTKDIDYIDLGELGVK